MTTVVRSTPTSARGDEHVPTPGAPPARGDVTIPVADGGRRLEPAEFAELFDRVRSWGPGVPGEDLGRAGHLGPEAVLAALSTIRVGESVSLALPVNTRPGPDNPRPALHHMVDRCDVPGGTGSPVNPLAVL